MKNLKNVKFVAKDWANNETVTGELSIRCRETLKTFDELKVKRDDGTNFDTNHHGYIVGIETENGFVMVNPDTVALKDKTCDCEKLECVRTGIDNDYCGLCDKPLSKEQSQIFSQSRASYYGF